MGKTLNFKLTEKKGNYGIIFQDEEPIAFAMFKEKNCSLAIAFKKGNKNNYSNGDIITSVFLETNIPYGMYDYRVTENNAIFNAQYNKYTKYTKKNN